MTHPDLENTSRILSDLIGFETISSDSNQAMIFNFNLILRLVQLDLDFFEIRTPRLRIMPARLDQPF